MMRRFADRSGLQKELQGFKKQLQPLKAQLKEGLRTGVEEAQRKINEGTLGGMSARPGYRK